MKTNFEEIMYKTWLKSEIIKQNKIFKSKKDNREINMQILINHIFNTNSKIAKKMREKTIDINGDISCDELMNFLSHTNKGDIIRWENSEGQKMYFLNRGKKLNGNDFENYIESLKEKASCHKSFIKTFPSRGQLYSNRDSSFRKI